MPTKFNREPLINATPWRLATAPFRALPDFLIIGAMKAGTTSLYDILARHPRIAPALRKEVHFFDLVKRHNRGTLFYRAFFDTTLSIERRAEAASGPVLTGEASPYYLYHPLAPARVAAALPGVKCIVLLREPVSRAWSHFQHARRYGWDEREFCEAVDTELSDLTQPERQLLADPSRHVPAHQLRTYVHRGQYAEQLERWFNAVGRERVLVLNAERFYRETDAQVRQVLEFLDLPAAPLRLPKPSNAGDYKDDMPDEIRQRLIEHFAPHNERLYALLGERYDWPTHA